MAKDGIAAAIAAPTHLRQVRSGLPGIRAAGGEELEKLRVREKEHARHCLSPAVEPAADRFLHLLRELP